MRDIGLMDQLDDDTSFAVHLYGTERDDEHKRFFTLASREQFPLTRVLPVLTDLGVDVVEQRPYNVTLTDGVTLHLSDFGLTSSSSSWGDEATANEFEAVFQAVWSGAVESDKLNSLVLRGGLDWRRIVVLRSIAMYLRQTSSAFSVEYLEHALIANPSIAVQLVRLFEARFDPAFTGDREDAAAEIRAQVTAALDDVASLDEDRILRSFMGVIEATLRTNFYQRDAAGQPKPWVSMKLDCASVPELPKPHPMAEIWVYSPQVEGLHLRFGKVARGGLRWSDRREDFRTEVLGLVKAQMVKNAVIVPAGSKGGFYAKQLPAPSDRAAWLEAGKEAYRTFIRGLLDLTDNRDGADIVPPTDVVRRDGDDPYLVVAADKGTASFSNIANAISREYGFWLDDAFASGGSAGYDHKGMAITARGAWESVKRHFRELDLDTQSEEFTAVGIGDMSGDVFGNGMLRSEHTRLVAAFDHRHVFVDPNPDAAASFAERKRLFELPGSSWDDFDRSVMSAGGGVFPLSAKSVDVTDEMRAALGIDASVTTLSPLELKRAVLLAPVDLLWNGAIGTYIKSSAESNDEIGDRGNDAIRVNGNELRVRVVGEGGNLGASQRGRIEAAAAGVHINTDAIDNSAGVGTSDREVNIKILLSAVERSGVLDRAARDELLQSMTDEVAVQVLRDNYEQNALIGNSRANGVEMLPSHERLMEQLESIGLLDRELEFLPSTTEVAERVANGSELTRPEFAVLLAYAKLALKDDLIESDFASDPWLASTLAEYFPEPIRERYAGELEAHPLRAEIIVNSVVNWLVNRGGVTFAYRAADETGASNEQIARAYIVAREVYDLAGFVSHVEETDNLLATDVQAELYLGLRRMLDRASRWFVQHRPAGVNIGAEIERFKQPLAQLTGRVGELLRGESLAAYEACVASLVDDGAPEALASWGAALIDLVEFPFLDIIEDSQANGREAAEVAGVYFALGDRLRIDEFQRGVARLPQRDRWGSMARASLSDDLYAVMIELTESVLHTTEAGAANDRVDAWFAGGATAGQDVLAEVLTTLQEEDDVALAPLSVALRRLRSLVR